MFSRNEFQRFLALIFLRQTVYGSNIIHGNKAPANSMQYMVSVQSNGHHVCGGFLISEDFVVTAAHCSIPTPDTVVVGNQDLQSANIKKIKIEYTCKFPTYKDVGYGDDIMLVKLSGRVNNGVKTIPIPTFDIFLDDNQICSVAGWGKTEAHNLSHNLRVTNVSIINPNVCSRQWNYTLPPNVICAGGYGTNKGFCQGDSGGPLVCNGIAVGVVSFNRSRNCNYPDVPNIYTDLSKYRHWLIRAMKEKRCNQAKF
ncbi:duodenase-1-like [Girardinichthys multiradiatus]|uniref:duodenase-1-like n=1 Tax=Girardinichthys multiradiatus TaxID=208333 RepID=UPI001FAD8164|nr:duodenase-1-like [Girardinichthys multiradiatus]